MIVSSSAILAGMEGQKTPSGRHVRRSGLPLPPGVDPLFARLWLLARRQGLNQRELAERAGVSHRVISRLLAGDGGMTTFTAAGLADAVGCEIAIVPKGSPLRPLVDAAVAWREALGDSAETWLTGPALDLVNAVDRLVELPAEPTQKGAGR